MMKARGAKGASNGSSSGKKAATSAASAAPQKKAAAAPQQNKRKRAAEPEPDSEEDDDDLDALLNDAAGDESEGEDAEDDDAEEIDIDPAEIAAMSHLYGRRGSAAASADEDDEDADEDGDRAMIGGGSDSSEDDGEEAADEGTGRIARPAAKKARKEKIVFLNNKVALEDKRADMALPASYPWIETLALTTSKSFEQMTGLAADAVHDDLKREAAFYELSLQAASEGLHRLTDLAIPFRIPPDFFAERVKPDKHMSRIKDKLIEERRKMDSVSERKKKKEELKFAKQVQSNKLQEKSAEKKAALEAASKLRKQNKADGKELAVERSILPGIGAHMAATRDDEAKRRERKNFKREAKDKKYGHGGKKRNVRKNDGTSSSTGKYDLGKTRANFAGFKDAKPGSFSDKKRGGGSGSNKGSGDFNRNGSSFSMGRSSRGGAGGGRGGRGGRGGGGGGRGGGANRPGKSSRAQSRK